MFVYLRWDPASCTISGADDRDRTGDLVLTKDVLCQLSYIGIDGLAAPRSIARGALLERETGIEPATNSLEGCDSTIELLPQTAHDYGGEGRIRTFEATEGDRFTVCCV